MSSETNNSKPVCVALTGGIGSGKSTALLMFAARGAAVLNSDSVVHELIDQDDIRAEVAESLGTGPLPPGEEGRRRISEVVFSDADKLTRLENILYPKVQDRIDAWLQTDEVKSAPAAVVELPMLFEAGMEDRYDVSVLVTAPEEARKTRHEGRVARGEFERRASRQLPEAEKRLRCDFSYDNVGSPEELDDFVAKTMSAILDRALRK